MIELQPFTCSALIGRLRTRFQCAGTYDVFINALCSEPLEPVCELRTAFSLVRQLGDK